MIRWLTHSSAAGAVFCVGLTLAYVALPLWLKSAGLGTDYGSLPTVGAMSVLFILAGAYGPKERVRWPRVQLSLPWFLLVIWAAFFSFVAVAVATAEKLPVVAALQGADSAQIAILREKFLKAREGWQAALVYANALFTGALIPYALSLMFVHRVRWRWVCFCLFLLYSISFVEKAFFLKGALPFLYLVAQRRIRIPVNTPVVIAGMIGLLFGVTALSRAGSEDAFFRGSFYTLTYIPTSPSEHLAWRSMVVPMVTAADALNVHKDRFDGRPLMGATSTILAAALGLERVPFERVVFSEQWGQNETGTGSANSVFFTEAYVNFSWVGVVVFSFVVGRLLRLMNDSGDEALQSLWMLLCFGLYTSGLIGLLLSNGFIVVFALALFARIEAPSSRRVRTPLESTSHGTQRIGA